MNALNKYVGGKKNDAFVGKSLSSHTRAATRSDAGNAKGGGGEKSHRFSEGQ